jgi:anti-sigma B factor antagonist
MTPPPLSFRFLFPIGNIGTRKKGGKNIRPMARLLPSLIPTGGIMDNISVNISEHPQSKGVTLLAFEGDINTATAPEFAEKFISILGKNKFKLVIDLKGVNYICSAGWGIFIGEIKRIRGRKGDLILAGMNPLVMEVFNLLEFNTLFKSFPNVETALQKGFD